MKQVLKTEEVQELLDHYSRLRELDPANHDAFGSAETLGWFQVSPRVPGHRALRTKPPRDCDRALARLEWLYRLTAGAKARGGRQLGWSGIACCAYDYAGKPKGALEPGRGCAPALPDSGCVAPAHTVGGMTELSWVLPPQGNKGSQTRRENRENKREIRGTAWVPERRAK